MHVYTHTHTHNRHTHTPPHTPTPPQSQLQHAALVWQRKADSAGAMNISNLRPRLLEVPILYTLRAWFCHFEVSTLPCSGVSTSLGSAHVEQVRRGCTFASASRDSFFAGSLHRAGRVRRGGQGRMNWGKTEGQPEHIQRQK
jgi:hypothetical protein